MVLVTIEAFEQCTVLTKYLLILCQRLFTLCCLGEYLIELLNIQTTFNRTNMFEKIQFDIIYVIINVINNVLVVQIGCTNIFSYFQPSSENQADDY